MMIHLINMPFGSTRNPSLALGQIKAQLIEAGFEAKVFNFNLLLARQIGISAYEVIGQSKGVDTQLGEWFFAEQAWGRNFPPPSEAFFASYEEKINKIGKFSDIRTWIRKVHQEVVPTFLQQCLELLIAAGEPRMLGFSCAFFQTTPALALTRLIKEHFPKAKTAFGGPCFQGEMGKELIDKILLLDAVATGEADETVVPLFQAFSEQREPAGLPGILYRNREGEVLSGGESLPVGPETLERLPFPDYNDFFTDSVYVGLNRDGSWRQYVNLYFEASRGCWWGQKCQCTFCGLNADGMNYRAKSGKRVYETIAHMAESYPVARLMASDNNMCMDYFQTLLPRLSESPFRDRIKLFFEIRTSFSREQMAALAQAGIVYVQPGVESLSTNVLKMMRKGVKAIRNVYFLKLCRQYGVYPLWNHIIRVPGERLQDYQEMEALIPKITHLQPPHLGEPRKLECHRFSIYYEERESRLKNVRPQGWYYHIFPPDVIDAEKVAYYFVAEWPDTLDDQAYEGLRKAEADWFQLWKQSDNPPEMRLEWRENGEAEILDGRDGSLRRQRLTQEEAELYRQIDDPCHINRLAPITETGEPNPRAAEITTVLERMVADGLAIKESNTYLGLAISRPKG